MRFIGCKALLLDNIKSVIDENAPDAKSFCDIFSGTATVARYFKQWYEVTSNDLLYFSYVLQRGTVAVDCLPTYEILIRSSKSLQYIFIICSTTDGFGRSSVSSHK